MGLEKQDFAAMFDVLARMAGIAARRPGVRHEPGEDGNGE